MTVVRSVFFGVCLLLHNFWGLIRDSLKVWYLDAPEKMDPGMENSVDSRKEPQCGSL